MNFAQQLSDLSSDFLDVLFPPTCIQCNTILLHQEDHICTKCRLSLPLTNYHLHKDNSLAQKFAFSSKVIAATAYLHYNKGGVAQQLIHSLKYYNHPEIGIMLGSWLGHDLKPTVWREVDMILPVPLHTLKLKRRGYNQSEYISMGIARELDLPIESEIVHRIRMTSTQTKKTKLDRWLNMEMVFKVTNPERLRNKKIMLVDDVITTGATLGEMIVGLEKCKVSSICIAALGAGK